VQRKVSGKLHEETNYGPTKEENKYVFRKKLEDLTLPMVDKIIDPVVREIVERRLKEKNIDLTGSGKPPKEVWSEPLYMKTTKSDKQVQIKKVRIFNVAKNAIPIKDLSGQPYRYVESGKNHHVEIFEITNSDNTTKRESKVVSIFEAVKRNMDGEPIVTKKHSEGTRFICSLAINDLVMMKNKNGEMDLYRVQKMDANKMVRFRHHTASTIERKDTYIDKTAHLFEGYKASVDPLGRICKAND